LEETGQEFSRLMRFVLGILFLVCVGGFLVTSGIMPIVSAGDAAKVRNLALSHSLPVLIAVAAPALLVIVALGLQSALKRTGWLAVGSLASLMALGAVVLAIGPAKVTALFGL
jgi:hypothetical protein